MKGWSVRGVVGVSRTRLSEDVREQMRREERVSYLRLLFSKGEE